MEKAAAGLRKDSLQHPQCYSWCRKKYVFTDDLKNVRGGRFIYDETVYRVGANGEG